MANVYREFDEETGIAIVEIIDKYGMSKGRARAHESDQDLVSEKTGLTIAEYKARIERERKRKVVAKKELERANASVKRAKEKLDQRTYQHNNLQKALKTFLENKEKFRKTHRKIKSREASMKQKKK